MTRARATIALICLVSIVPALTLFASLAITQAGRNHVVADTRDGCIANSRRNAEIVDVWRAQHVHNAAAFRVFLARIDPSDIPRLTLSADRQHVRGLRPRFSCEHAYPPSGLLP